MNEKKSAILETVFAGAIVAYFLGTNIYYYAHTLILNSQLEYLNNFIHDPSLYEHITRLWSDQGYYPPVYYAWLIGVAFLFGLDYEPFYFSSAVLALAGSVYLYLLLRKTAGRSYACFGLFLFLLLPGTTVFTKRMFIEAPFALILPAVFYHLHATALFTSRKHAVFLGLWTGLGMLTKWSFPLYCLGIYLYFVAVACFDFKTRAWKKIQPRQLLNFSIFLTLACIMTGSWYLFQFNYQNFLATGGNDPIYPEFILARQIGHNLSLVRIMTGAVWGWVALAVTFLLLLGSTRRSALVGAFAALFAFPIFMLSLPAHLEDRYFYPLTVSLGLFIPLVVAVAKHKAVRVVAAVVLCLALGYNHLIVYAHPDRNEHKRYDSVAWGRVHTQEILAYLQETALRLSIDRPIVVAKHPMWNNDHIADSITYYFGYIDDRFRNRFIIYSNSVFEYKTRFSSVLQTFDFILLDEDWMRDHQKLSPQLIQQQMPWAFRPYIEQMSGRVAPVLKPEDLFTDFARIERDFVKLTTMDYGEYNKTAIYMNRALDPDLGSVHDNQGVAPVMGDPQAAKNPTAGES